MVINEFVPDTSPEWVEFYNASDSAEFIKSYWLDDDVDFTNDGGSSAKKILSDLSISNPSYPYIETNSFLNNSGDYVVLFDQLGNIVDQYQYTVNPGDDISIGRSPDKSGGFTILTSSTKGLPNSESQPTPTPTPEPEEESEEESTSATPIPTSTPIPISTPTKKPTPTKTPTPTPTPTGEILGEEATPEAEVISFDTPQESTPSSFHLRNFLPFIFIGLGSFFLAFAGGSVLLPQIKKKYNKKRGENKPII